MFDALTFDHIFKEVSPVKPVDSSIPLLEAIRYSLSWARKLEPGPEFAKSQRAVENRGKWRKLVAKSSVVHRRPSRLMGR